MNKLDFYPAKSSFTSLYDVAFYLTCQEVLQEESSALISISHLGQQLYSESVILKTGEKKHYLPISIEEQTINWQNCGFSASCVVSHKGSRPNKLHTAFDCNPSWANNPRYGFLCDFQPDRHDIAETIEELLKFHINGLQFYDWQYRHEQLIPNQILYEDILGRQLSLDTIIRLIECSHLAGIACMPYLAIYGASLAYWRTHQDSALYNAAGQPITFHDFLGLMDPSPDSDWTAHLSSECEKVLDQLPFDGLHIDQYGEPQKAYDSNGKTVNLPTAFVNFINNQKQKYKNKTIVFNAVKNWPIEALCSSREDFTYIEIWPPAIHYQDLVQIIHNAQQLSNNKPVVLALYIPARRTANVRLSNAVILASGASRVEIGENARYLSNPYFPKHQAISPSLYKSLRRYYDFAVAYQEWLKPNNCDSNNLKIQTPEEVLCLMNNTRARKIIHLINFNQIDEKRWDKQHSAPRSLREFQITVPTQWKVKQVQLASPDDKTLCLHPAQFYQANHEINISITSLKYWTMISIETEND